MGGAARLQSGAPGRDDCGVRELVRERRRLPAEWTELWHILGQFVPHRRPRLLGRLRAHRRLLLLIERRAYLGSAQQRKPRLTRWLLALSLTRAEQRAMNAA